ncbi:hypothetical protein SCUCBS95973_006740 [Sporothrix curviconia]|uniref:Histone deacetylase complex subunit SAP30 Sin3 binding domain-containing protein n=1 Tax=Sporothrix curviconia TaxID=1260050 RepID=A0ABP0C8Q3_9PEZI
MAPSKPRANADDAHGAAGHGAGSSAAANSSSAAGSAANGTGSTAHTTANGKARRTAAATASAAVPAQPSPPVPVASQNPTLQWNEFERGVLHGYTRAFSLDEAGAFANEFARWILSQPGSVGLQSPTMLRRQDMRRQSKMRLASAVRKHFNGQGSQENDIVVDFLHKVQTHEVVRQRRPRRMGSNAREIDG